MSTATIILLTALYLWVGVAVSEACDEGETPMFLIWPIFLLIVSAIKTGEMIRKRIQ